MPLHDYGCSLKAYRREVLQGFRLYGEMHRFIPIYAAAQGARVRRRFRSPTTPRKFGQSKYGLNRTIKVLLDLLRSSSISPASCKWCASAANRRAA